jgi:excinuclease UvrABC helicase subunit UvrB
MTEVEMQRIAEIIVSKIIEQQRAYDAEFKADMEDLISDKFEVDFELANDTELIYEEILILQEKLNSYVRKEEYEKAGVLRDKIKYLKQKYKL